MPNIAGLHIRYEFMLCRQYYFARSSFSGPIAETVKRHSESIIYTLVMNLVFMRIIATIFVDEISP
jgi:hypothetical protein